MSEPVWLKIQTYWIAEIYLNGDMVDLKSYVSERGLDRSMKYIKTDVVGYTFDVGKTLAIQIYKVHNAQMDLYRQLTLETTPYLKPSKLIKDKYI